MSKNADHNLSHLKYFCPVLVADAATVAIKEAEYEGSWKRKGGKSAFHMLERKWDRLQAAVSKYDDDLFEAIAADSRQEGLIDDIRDLRVYLLLVESEMLRRQRIKLARPYHDLFQEVDASEGPVGDAYQNREYLPEMFSFVDGKLLELDLAYKEGAVPAPAPSAAPEDHGDAGDPGPHYVNQDPDIRTPKRENLEGDSRSTHSHRQRIAERVEKDFGVGTTIPTDRSHLQVGDIVVDIHSYPHDPALLLVAQCAGQLLVVDKLNAADGYSPNGGRRTAHMVSVVQVHGLPQQAAGTSN